MLPVCAMVGRELADRSRPCAICQGINLNLNPSRSKIRLIWRTSFYIHGFAQSVDLGQPIFKRKKGFATISLGLF
jgi:hypothetical protein